jgi:hypothetical protein
MFTQNTNEKKRKIKGDRNTIRNPIQQISLTKKANIETTNVGIFFRFTWPPAGAWSFMNFKFLVQIVPFNEIMLLNLKLIFFNLLSFTKLDYRS